MVKADDLFTARKSLGEICTVPDKIISVYSLEKHVWADGNSEEARRDRKPELQTIEEFKIDPVRPFLTDILRNMAAPYKPERKDNPIGQGYWVQAEFGSGKSHLLCMLSALALGDEAAWEIVQKKESESGRGKRESLYRFWEEGLKAKSGDGTKGVFVIVSTLVGVGGGTVGYAEKGQTLTEYILDAAKEQIQVELGKNISLYPTEQLADRFLAEDLDRYRNDLKKFLKDPKYFEEDEFEDIDEFIKDIQENLTPEYKRSRGNKLWRFYTEYLKVKPDIASESEEILKHLVETIMAEGYSGVLVVLDEVSLFMKNRDESQRTDDEKTLVVLSNRLGKVHNLPIWTVCAAQQAIESKLGVKNIIADDRLKLVKLLEEDKDYFDIVLSRVREIVNPEAINNYYLFYKRGFTWPSGIGEDEFAQFFPFHKPALEVLRAITYELTTTRSAIHFMHQTLKHQIKAGGKELIRLWELFDETVQYEEDPSGVHAGIASIKTKKETEYKAYEAGKRDIDGLTKGTLKVHRDKAVKILQTLFLYHIAKTKQQGLSPEEISNSVLIERDAEANPEENIQHYETIADNLKKELPQISESMGEARHPRYKFEPAGTEVKPRELFEKARDEAEANEVMRNSAWEHLLAMDEWPVKTRQMTLDLSSGVKSVFRDISPFIAPWESPSTSKSGDQTVEVKWQGRLLSGLVGMRNLKKTISEKKQLPLINSDETDLDFEVIVADNSVPTADVDELLQRLTDPRIILWVPDELKPEEQEFLLDFAAYRKLVSDYQGKDSEDSVAVINWVADSLQTNLGKIVGIIDKRYARGRICAKDNSDIKFHVAGELTGIIAPIVDHVLSEVYESKDIKFDDPIVFRKEEGVKVINGIVKTGEIPKGVKRNQNIDAAHNFGFGLKIIKRGADRVLDVSDNQYVDAIWKFIDTKLTEDAQTMKVETLFKNFMGMGSEKPFGLTRRMVQLYLLCLVQQGKVKVSVGPKAGIMQQVIDYSNIADIEFSAKVMDFMAEVQKMAKPENWEVLRPYAEKLLNTNIPVTHDDAVISDYRRRLREHFESQKEESASVLERAASLFTYVGAENPYEREVAQVAALCSHDLSSGDDIELALFALKESLGYKAFDDSVVSQEEIDDLANRLKNYRDIEGFLRYDQEVRTAFDYCKQALPDEPALAGIKNEIQSVSAKLGNLKLYIDSDVKLKTVLIGHSPPEKDETGTVKSLISAFTTAYVSIHDQVHTSAEKAREKIGALLNSDDLKALAILEGITALQPAVSESIREDLEQTSAAIFSCSASKAEIEEHLKREPAHSCGLTFANAKEKADAAGATAETASQLLDAEVDKKLEVFLNPKVKERLEQGKAEAVIGGLLKCKGLADIKESMVKAALSDKTVVKTINKYLKRIVVKPVNLSDFKPKSATVEKEQIPAVADEFAEFLKEQIEQYGPDDLPVLRIE